MKSILKILVVILLAACSKNNSDDNGTTPAGVQITETDLASTGGKMWDINQLNIIYYNSGGGIDSTVTRTLTTSSVFYFGAASGGRQYYTTDPLNAFVPSAGTWLINANQTSLTFNCISPYCTPTSTEQWTVTAFSPRNAYGESLNAEQTQSLSGGRKRVLKIRLYKQ